MLLINDSLEGLVLSGAFDSCGTNRATLFDSIETALEWGHKVRNSRLSNSDSLFGGVEDEVKISEPVLPELKPWSAEYRLAKEREVLGFYVTGHPLTKFEFDYRTFASIHLGETEELEDNNDVVKACGVSNSSKDKDRQSRQDDGFFYIR